MPEALTPIERRIYNFVIDHLKKETYQPSVREIGSHFGIRSTKTVTEHLQALQRKGYLDRTPARSRALKILGLDLAPEVRTIPVYSHGSIVGEVPEANLNVDRSVACSADCFFVRVRGGHLQGQGVSEGDLILVEPPDAPSDGDRLVVERDGRIEMRELRALSGATVRDGTMREDGFAAADTLAGIEDGRPAGAAAMDERARTGLSVAESGAGPDRILGIARALLRQF